MEKKPISILFLIGSTKHYLTWVEDGYPITLDPPVKGMHGVLGSIGDLMEALSDFGLHVTRRAAAPLDLFGKEIAGRPPGSKLTKQDADRLREIMAKLENTFDAEAGGIHGFFVTEKRLPVEALLGDVAKLFPAKVYDELPEMAKYDVNEAGKCIVFSCPTAAAFHILRAAEAVLGVYYCRIVRQKKSRVPVLTWGTMTRDFSAHRKKPPETIIKNLEYIRSNFRNPTAHPQARYDIEEAQQVFNLCVDLIARIVGDRLWRDGRRGACDKT